MTEDFVDCMAHEQNMQTYSDTNCFNDAHKWNRTKNDVIVPYLSTFCVAEIPFKVSQLHN